MFTFDIQTGISTCSPPVPDCVHHPESASPTIPQSAFTSAAGGKTDVITLSKVEVSAAPGENEKRDQGRRGVGGVDGFPLTGWQLMGHGAHLSLAAGLSAAPVNLPDRSLQVPLIPLIQFIWLTVRI